MHRYDEWTHALATAVFEYTRDRLQMDPVPLDGPRSARQLAEEVGETITGDGLGPGALKVFAERLAPACISTDHPRYLSFIPCAPTEASTLFDLVVGASSIYAGSWLEGAGAVYAENQALAWLAGLAGLPSSAGGAFVSGGTVGNLSALVAARHHARQRAQQLGVPAQGRWAVLASAEAHSSIAAACEVMDVDFVAVDGDADGRLTGSAVAAALADRGRLAGRVPFAVVATAGTTNLGLVDDLAGIATASAAAGVWFHVDGAYGLAGLAAPSIRPLFDGIERADSFVVDPHKWLFAPFDCCALVYRRPELARAAHTQSAGYLDVVTGSPEWSPADYAIGLTRRARGLPFWFSLATHGTRAYTRAVERTLEVARFAAAEIDRRPELELVSRPALSVLAFRRLGWSAADHHAWSDRLLRDEFAFVVPTVHAGETIARFAIVNPTTTESDISAILDTMGDDFGGAG